MTVPVEGSATGANQIQINWSALTGSSTGNSAILSYNLYWNNGAGATTITVVDSLVTTYTITGLTTGTTYKFKVRARNIYGYGSFSSDVDIIASSVPDTMNPVTTTLNDPDIEITWIAPASNGLPLTEYDIQLFVPTTLSYVTDLTYCSGSDPLVLTCSFPINTLLTTYGFLRGDLVQARVRAKNSKGFGGYSTLNTVGATVQTVPTFMNAPSKALTSTSTQLDIVWSAITANADTGASPITSYSLEWDQGTNTYDDLVGFTAPDTSLSYSKSGLVAGTLYKFRLRAENALGWGPYSTVVSMTPSGVPSQMAAVTTAVVGSSVKISWTPPTTNGATITAYKIVIVTNGGTVYLEDTTYCDGSAP